MGGEADFIDEKKIAEADGGSTLPGDLVSFCNVDDVDEGIDELGRKSSGKIVTATFDEDDLESIQVFFKSGDCLGVDRGVVTDGGVRAAAGFNSDDAFLFEGILTDEKFGVFLCVDVIGDDGEAVLFPELLTEPEDEHGFTGADGPPIPIRTGRENLLMTIFLRFLIKR